MNIYKRYGELDLSLRINDFDNEDEMNRYMERVKEESIFYRDIKVEDIVEEEGISSLITMVTCSYEFDDARTLVSAALKPVQ